MPGDAPGETPAVEIAAKLDELDLGLRQKLESLGLDEWAFARSVIMDTTDLAMAGERLNQIVAQLTAMDSRESFLDEMVAPVLEEPRGEGLNRKHRWLRLPVCLPNGNIWAGGYFALTSLHMLLVVVVAVISVPVLMHKSDAAPSCALANHRMVVVCSVLDRSCHLFALLCDLGGQRHFAAMDVPNSCLRNGPSPPGSSRWFYVC